MPVRMGAVLMSVCQWMSLPDCPSLTHPEIQASHEASARRMEEEDAAASSVPALGRRRSHIRRRWSGWPVASRRLGEGDRARHVTT